MIWHRIRRKGGINLIHNVISNGNAIMKNKTMHRYLVVMEKLVPSAMPWSGVAENYDESIT